MRARKVSFSANDFPTDCFAVLCAADKINDLREFGFTEVDFDLRVVAAWGKQIIAVAIVEDDEFINRYVEKLASVLGIKTGLIV